MAAVEPPVSLNYRFPGNQEGIGEEDSAHCGQRDIGGAQVSVQARLPMVCPCNHSEKELFCKGFQEGTIP